MSILENIREKASKNLKKIVLPESYDARTMEAIEYILDNKISRIVVVGDDSVRRKIRSKNTDLLEVLNPATYKDAERWRRNIMNYGRSKG